MGIRFACHVCERRLNIKQELAGRRGICPVCAARIRIPLADAEKSTPVDDKKPVAAPQVTNPQVAAGSDAAISSNQQPTPTREATASPSPVSTSPVSTSPTSTSTSPTTTTDVADSSESVDEIFTEDTEATWYVRPPSGGQYGPATTEVLKQWIEEGRVATTALLWREGWPQWREANEALPEFASRLPDTGGGAPSFTATSSSEIAASGSDSAESRSSLTGTPGQTDLESARRSQSKRRMMTIGVLSLVALSLILALVFFAFR